MSVSSSNSIIKVFFCQPSWLATSYPMTVSFHLIKLILIWNSESMFRYYTEMSQTIQPCNQTPAVSDIAIEQAF